MRFRARWQILGVTEVPLQRGDLIEMPLSQVAELVSTEFGGVSPSALAPLIPVDSKGDPATPPAPIVRTLRRLITHFEQRKVK